MRFVSTRGTSSPVGLSDALAVGLAPDGGLFVPESLPHLAADAFDRALTLPQVAACLLRPYFDADALSGQLDAICEEAFDFDAPLRSLEPTTSLLELFHGPTAAFKDYGARFLAACLRRLRKPGDPVLTIVVATSGDTGAAVGGAFHNVPGLRVVILYPDGRVSPRQAHQLGAFGDNVQALRVAGNFDDCQALVKRALADTGLQRTAPLSSANSISLGRLLPQMAYHAHAAITFQRDHGAALNLVVPTGNLGNGLAAILAREGGLPLGRIALASNANQVLPDFFAGSDYQPQSSVATLANAMDVGAPSNFERLRWLQPDAARLRSGFASLSVDDAQIRACIQRVWQTHGVAVCPHTATGLHLREVLRTDDSHWAVAATAHPAKFESIVEPLIHHSIELPPALKALLARPSSATPMAPDYDDFRTLLQRLARTSD